MLVSFTVSTAETLLLLESKASTTFRVGEIAISPGEPPLLSGLTLAITSFVPSSRYRPPKLVELETP